MILASVLGPLEDLFRNILEFLHTSIGLPWAWSIVALTVIVRVCLVPLTIKQIHSMQRLQRHAPQMKEIQRKYKQDRQRMNEELMRFYKENQINPAASCLPLLAQFPVFISLYFVLRNFTKHVHATPHELSWLGFVPDITAKASHHWSGFLLLAIYAGSQVASTFFMSTTMDKTQRTLLMVLPVAFLFIIVNFPVGLVLYWMTTNLWTVGQGLITRRLVPKTPAPTLQRARAPRRPRAEGDRQEPAEPKRATEPKQAAPAQQQQVRRVKRKKKKARPRR
jgi:YidC/Oxa1 family membrane protein insertase